MILNPFEFAAWIFADCKESPICDRYFEYHTTFTASPGNRTFLSISAYSQYAVYVNDTFINCGQYDDYEDYQVYDTLEITDSLRDGSNTLYIGHYVCGSDFSTRRKQIPGIIFSVYTETEHLLSSNPSCLSRANMHFLPNTEKITGQLGYNFEYDSTHPEAEYVPSIPAGKEKHLFPRPISKLLLHPFQAADVCAQGYYLENPSASCKAERMQTAYLSACRQKDCFRTEATTVHWSVPDEASPDGVYLIFDLKQECAGLLSFILDVPDTAEVLIGFGEHLQDLRVRSFVGGRNFCFRYLAKKGRQTFFYPYQRIGLRYLQFHIACRSGSIKAGIHPQEYPVRICAPALTNPLHKRIHQVCVNTLKLCMHEHYEDCPWREQALYAMDSRVQILCGYYAFQEYTFPRASLLLMARSLRPDHLLELCAPGKVSVNIPSFTAVFLREVLEYSEYSKDWTLAEEIFPVLHTIADGFAQRIADNDLIPLYCGKEYWNFYEWKEGLDGAGRHTEPIFESPLNAFVSDAFRCFSKLCEHCAPDLAETYRDLHLRMNQAIHTAFFDPDTQAYRTRLTDSKPLHTLTQGLLLYVDAVPEEYREKVAQSILSNTLIPCSVSMTIYVYEALLGLGSCYLEYVLQEIERIWGRMLLAGADTFWETEEGASDFAYAGSLCHGWSAVPIYILGKYFNF